MKIKKKKKKLGKNMMKTRTPTQIKELKNTNLNTEFSFLTHDCPQMTTANPSKSATNPSEQTTPPKSD